MSDSIFQKIIKKEVPANIIYEDENFLCFLDIAPVKKGHLLLITKTPYRWMQDVPDNILSEIFILTKKIMSHMIKNLNCDFVQIGIVGKDVPHFHIHLIPRSLTNDDVSSLLPGYTYDKDEIQSLVEKLKL